MKVMGVCVLGVAACQFSAAAHFGGDKRVGGGGDSHSVTVPDLFGMTKDEALAAMRGAGITGELEVGMNQGLCGSVVDGKVVELDRVCRQQPAAGQVTSSTLFVSVTLQTENPWRGDLGDGRHWYLLPNVIGLSLDQAYAKLRAAGFTTMDVFHIRSVDQASCKPNIVCEMYPDPMTRADNSSDKMLTVGALEQQTDPGQPPVQGNSKGPPPASAQTLPAKKSGLGDLF